MDINAINVILMFEYTKMCYVLQEQKGMNLLVKPCSFYAVCIVFLIQYPGKARNTVFKKTILTAFIKRELIMLCTIMVSNMIVRREMAQIARTF